MNYKVPLSELLFMRLRGVPVLKIQRELKKAARHRLQLGHMDLQMHWLAAGDITDLVDSMIFAKENEFDLSFQTAAAEQLMCKYQEESALLEKLKMMQDSGVKDVEDFLRSGFSPAPNSQ